MNENKQTEFFMLYDTYDNEKNKAEQFLQECTAWLRLLDFFRQENSYLKTRLSMAVDHKTDKDFLNLAEQYQNKFILKDEFINEIMQDAKKQEETIKDIISKKSMLEERIIKKQQKLRNETEYLEKDYTKLKNDFNRQLSIEL